MVPLIHILSHVLPKFSIALFFSLHLFSLLVHIIFVEIKFNFFKKEIEVFINFLRNIVKIVSITTTNKAFNVGLFTT